MKHHAFDQTDWNLIRAFLATVESGSLSAAAKRLGLSQPTLSRQITTLEQDLQLVLFERIGKRLVLTDVGRHLAASAEGMRGSANAFALAASGSHEDIAGEVVITATDLFALSHLPQIIEQLERVAPRVKVSIRASDDVHNLQLREADIAIRHQRPTQSELIARLVFEASARLYASPAYLTRFSTPIVNDAGLVDLEKHRLISFGAPARMIAVMRELGIEVPDSAIFHDSENGVVAWQMAQQGLGIIPMSDAIARLAPNMVAVDLPGTGLPMRFPIWLVTHRELHTSPKIRTVFDLLARELPKQLGS